MRSFKQIKNSYRFTPEDEKRLVDMKPLMEDHVDEVMESLSLWELGSKETATFFSEESRRTHVFTSQRQWFLNLFSGKYDHKFYERLIRIGAVHVKYRVAPHFMNTSVNVIRNTCIDILIRSEDAGEEQQRPTHRFTNSRARLLLLPRGFPSP
jgi:hypothetical protein